MASPPSSPEISAALGGEEQYYSFSYKDATEEEIMEELTTRFILNLPDDELASLQRVCFQVEQAHWFYEDFIREQNRRCPSLPLKKFTAMLFSACPVLQHYDPEEAFQYFVHYKTQVPVCGAIMLNETWDKCVLVKGWKSSSGWGFPKGKINEGEPKDKCAIREVHEETGYNLTGKLDSRQFIEMENSGQQVTLFIVPGVPEDTEFKTKTRKEISRIEWFKLADLPSWRKGKHATGKFYLIAPFIPRLKAFIIARRPRKLPRKIPKTASNSPPQVEAVAANGTDSDALQDSSSQASSLNGGPQTPSPQYTESQPAFVPQIAGEGRQVPLAAESLDPHFAKLLSGLTMSAAPAQESVEPVKLEPPSMLQTIFMSAKQTTETTAVPSEESITPKANNVQSKRIAPDQPTPTAIKTTTDTSVTISQVTAAVPPSIVPLPAQPSNPVLIPADKSEPTNGLQVTAKASFSPSISPRSPTFRKSSTADISPYLARPMATEMPVSAKRLQQLALLESVATESARMTPKLREATPSFSSIAPPPHPPIPDGRYAPTPYLNGGSRDLRPLAPPATGPMGFMSPGFPPPFSHHIPQHHDPFIVRSQTSQAIHRPNFHAPPGSASMTHQQLLNMISNTRPGPAPRPPPHSFAPGPSAPFSNAGQPPFPLGGLGTGMPTQFAHPPTGQFSAFHPPPHQYLAPGPRPFSVAPHNSSAGALLSILNSPVAPKAVPAQVDPSQFPMRA